MTGTQWFAPRARAGARHAHRLTSARIRRPAHGNPTSKRLGVTVAVAGRTHQCYSGGHGMARRTCLQSSAARAFQDTDSSAPHRTSVLSRARIALRTDKGSSRAVRAASTHTLAIAGYHEAAIAVRERLIEEKLEPLHHELPCGGNAGPSPRPPGPRCRPHFPRHPPGEQDDHRERRVQR